MMLLPLMSLCVPLLGAAPAARCRCAPEVPITSPRLASEFLAPGRAAFRGRVGPGRAVQDTIGSQGFPARPLVIDAMEYKVAVLYWWGGTGFDTVLVRTPDQPGMCGAEIVPGQEYLFLSYNHQANRVTVTSCLAPRRPESATDLMRMLDSAAARHRPSPL